MRKFSLSTVATAAVLSSGAFAADLPVRSAAVAPVPVFVASSWTGFYVGVHGGAAWMRGRSNFVPLQNGVPGIAGWNRSPESFNQNKQSGAFGLHLGYNWQAGSNLLFGVELDGTWTGLKATHTIASRDAAGVAFAPVSPVFMGRDVNWLASARGRLGFVANNLLIYVTGGVAAGDVKYRSNLQSVGPGINWGINASDTEFGYVLGAGAEYKFNPNLLLRAEYLYYNLSGRTAVANGVPAILPAFQIRYNWRQTEVHVARVGLSYLFSSAPGAVVAKY